MTSTQRARRAALVATALVVVAVLGAAVAGPWHPVARTGWLFTINVPQITEQPRPTETALPPHESSTGAPSWAVGLAIFVALVLLGLLGALAARAMRRWLDEHRPPEQDGADPGEAFLGDVADLALPALAQGLRDAAVAIDRDVPPGDAVIAAWIALEAAAERSGVLREPSQTATEFTVGLLDETEADPAQTRALLDLYLAARFSEHRVTDADVARARAALGALADGVRHLRHDHRESDEPDESDESDEPDEPDEPGRPDGPGATGGAS
ncbi:DUF4129 domain-containing protein [Cellulomonas composti]|uniref:Protein-glutamine gamma-glutamyltransferase-like C-terminal domain-containing protein n=1 Tax=Cellulomonas composti TaxID=266130 RepID=A0A511JDG8_9CELL|nr:DUF4129 domain-containing protein [Cellulomonas composti]GEL96037.1 hypothetical protein CCO02nite_26950 [Cellulomonas composti]